MCCLFALFFAMGIEGYKGSYEKGKLATTSNRLTSLAKAVVKKNVENTENRMKVILDNAQLMSTQNYTYGMGNHQYVCDTFVKKVLSSSGSKTFE